MEVFAAFGEGTGHEIGRLVDAVGDLGQLDNTLIFYIVGDNGASAEGGTDGMLNEMTYFNSPVLEHDLVFMTDNGNTMITQDELGNTCGPVGGPYSNCKP
jgi:hypothetical protein